MGLLSFLFGGRREGSKPPARRDPGADMIRVATPAKADKPKPAPAKADAAKVNPAKANAAKPASIKSMAATAASSPVMPIAATPATDHAASGPQQVKLRLRLAAARRAGDLEAAYEAARALEDIQKLAGRRVGARLWREQAERIFAEL
jgi:hypothetical protein